MSGLVRLEGAAADGVAVVVLDNPPMNALSFAAQTQLDEVLGELERSADVRAVVVTGATARAFSAGAEISELPLLREPGQAERVVARLHAIFDRLERLPQPTIAAIDGAAVGGGAELALACTFRVAGEKARFGLPEVSLGVIPGGGGTQRLPGVVGRARALDLVLNARVIGADEAHALGLVHRLAPAGEARSAAASWAAELAARPRTAVQAAKRALLAAGRPDGFEVERSSFAEAAVSEDMREGVSAFLDKRTPVFRHR